MAHHRARFTAVGRWDVARHVIEDGETFARAAARADVSSSTVWGWVERWRAATREDRASLACPDRVPDLEAAGICALREKTGWSPRRLADEPGIDRPHSTVHQVLRRGGCSRRPMAPRPAVVRYEWPCPRQLLHMDVKKFGQFTDPGHRTTGDRTRTSRPRRVGWEYVHTILDDRSRVAYSEIHDDEQAPTVTAFTRRALDWFLELGICSERLMTDNAWAYTNNRSLRLLLRSRQITRIRSA
jgi:transposase-like protein